MINSCDFEEKWILNDNDCLTVWLRYADDTFTLFPNKDSAINFLHHLNGPHNNIQFTIEFQLNCEIPFLDVLVRRNQNNSFSTAINRKKRLLAFTLNGPPLHHLSIRLILSAHFPVVVSTSVNQPLYYNLPLMI